MKHLFIFSLLSLLTSSSFAQDTLTVVAVGEAEKEKEEIAFVRVNTESLNAKQIKDMDKLIGIIQSDFKFYGHVFKVEDSILLTPEGYTGAIYGQFKIAKEGETISLTASLHNVQKKEKIFEETRDVNFSQLRVFSHEISHNFYRAITGKSSIFKTKIVFVSDKISIGTDTKKELYIMDFDGARKQRLTFYNSLVISPALSPDNSKILFTLIEGKWIKTSSGEGTQKVKNLNLHMLDLRTKKTKTISSAKGINSGAVFDTTGENIYLTLSYLKNADIFKMNLKTRKKKRITKHFSDDVDPHVNATGSLLTFLSGRPGKAMIYTMDPTGLEKSVKRISYVGRFNAAPRFNPDGTQIVFSSWVDDRFDIYRIDSDGRNLVRLTKNFGSNEEPWFSPDGEFIVFTSQRVITRKRAVQDVYIMNRDGEVVRKITENYGKVYTPRWSN